MKATFCNQRKRGLTLVELLVIIAIITFLAMMVNPGGRMDKMRALRIQCIKNLKQDGLQKTVANTGAATNRLQMPVITP